MNDQRIHGTFAWHGNMKLNEKDVLEIVRRIDAGETLNSLAAEYGVAHGVISGINLGNYWPSVTGRKREDASLMEKKARSLTKEDVTKIIELLDSGFSQRSIAEAFRCKPQNIYDIQPWEAVGVAHRSQERRVSAQPLKKGQAKHYVKAVLGEE